MINRVIHHFSHLLKQNKYNVISWKENGCCFIALQCKECGKIEKPGDSFKLTEETENDYNDTNS